ncbi:molybdopterin-containing oxidoreductase family protein [Elongatibacter sediminis]|uniref:Molybdopterin-dependent oxidoreductase n=1 Tax=Elongatibacter sediminis TaxID=3119006 RepID=A0AAW9RHN6_9GAMM
MEPETRHAICRFCHAMCAVKLTLEDGRVTRIIGDKDNPVYHGYTCIKGRNFHEFHYAPNRVLHPLARGSDGELQPLPLDEALDGIAGRLSAIIAEHGPRSVAIYGGTFSNFCPAGVMTRHAFMDAIGSPMRFSNATIDQPGKPIAMALHGRWGAGPQPFDSADVCLVIGANPLVSMWGGVPPFNPARRLHQARKRGLKLIVIDPRRTETARKAELHLQCLPGNDAAILAAMIRVILDEDLHDAGFVDAETQGFDALRDAVAAFTPEAVAAVAGLEPEAIREAARLFAGARRGIATGGTGSNMAPFGTLMEYLMLVLNTLCGRWIRAGETIPNPGVLFRMSTGKARAEKPRPAYGFGEPIRVRGLADTAAGMPTAALPDEILTPGEGQIRALFVVGGNPMANWPNRSKVEQALKSLDLLVAIDPQVGATSRLADYVIGPKFGFEIPATSFASEGITFYGLSLGMPEPWAQYQPALIDPPENSEVIEDWRVFYELARRMDLELSWFGQAYDMTRPPTTDDLLELFLKRAPVPLDEIRDYPGGREFPEQAVPAAAKESDWPFRLELGHPDMMTELGALADALGHPSALAASITGFDGRPLLLTSRRQHEVYNSVGQDLPALRRKRPYNPVYLNPVDAGAIGVGTGDAVELQTAAGCVPGIAELAEDVRPGVVSVAHGFPNRDAGEAGAGGFAGTAVAELLDDAVGYDRFSGLPVMSAVPVVVRAAGPAAA